MLLKLCSKCSEVKPVEQFYYSSHSGDGYHAYCKGCFAALYYCKGPNRPRVDVWGALVERFRPAFDSRTKYEAQRLLNAAIRRSQAHPPLVCENCWSESRSRLHAHHSDYSKPLDVVWLCAGCHRELHRQIELRGNRLAMDGSHVRRA